MKRCLGFLALAIGLAAADQWTDKVIGPSTDHFPFKINSHSKEGDSNYIAPSYPIQPFKQNANNPVLTPNPDHHWESAYTFNPTAIVIDDTVFLLYRAQDANLTSSIGLAWSRDGYHFTRLSEPIISATEVWETDGGCEDPRIVRINGTFYVTYTGYNKPINSPKLVMASSEDLIHWTKYPPVFPELDHSKSAAIVREPDSHGYYHMYWGDTNITHAISRNVLNWTNLAHEPFAKGVFEWETLLIESGPAPIKTRDGLWIFFHNGARRGPTSSSVFYSVGEMLIDPFNLTIPDISPPVGIYSPAQEAMLPELQDGPVARLERPVIFPTQPEEMNGQVPNVTFCEGVVQFRGKWFMYFGQADTTVGLATAEVEPKLLPWKDYSY